MPKAGEIRKVRKEVQFTLFVGALIPHLNLSRNQVLTLAA